MNRKTLILGAVLAAFMMLMIPNISAVNEQVKEDPLNLDLINIEGFNLRGFVVRLLGFLCMGIGIFYYGMAIAEPLLFLGFNGLYSALYSIIYSLIEWLEGDTAILAIMDGLSASVGIFAFLLVGGFFYFRIGTYMLLNGQIPDQDTINSWKFFSLIANLAAPDLQI